MNYRLDSRLAALAERRGLSYSRYADDMMFSARYADLLAARRTNPKTLAARETTQPRVNGIIQAVKVIVADEGYRLHIRKKLYIYRRRHRQTVTGLVVNERPNLSRDVRRRLRAVEHHLRNGRTATMTPAQLAGWQALQHMIAQQR